jgi:amino acid transporter
VLFARHIALLDIFGYLGTIGTLAVLFAYLLVAFAAPLYLRKRGELTPSAVAIAVAAVVAVLVPIFGSLFPVPPAPYNILPYVFLGLLAVGGGRFAYLAVAKPSVIKEIEADLLAQGESA